MSFPPPPDLPPSEQFIKCNAYKDRIADLAWGKKDDPIIGYRYKGGSNQKWTFHREGTTENYKISTTADGGETVYADSASGVEGSIIYGSASSTIYTVGTVGGGYKISMKAADKTTDLYWTLGNENESTRITLEKNNGVATQVWSID